MDLEIKGFVASHKGRNIADLEELKEENRKEKLNTLCDESGVKEAFLLETCNRVEYYLLIEDDVELDFENFSQLDTWKAIEHLMRVSCGLESVVIGEDEILGQLKDARALSRDIGSLENRLLDKTLEKCIKTGQKVRRETSINEGERSITSATVGKAREEIDIKASSVMIIGLGDIGRSLLEYIKPREVYAGVKNVEDKNFEEGKLLSADKALEMLEDVDVLFTATSSDEYVVQNCNLPDCIFDLANPRDVNPEAVDDSKLYDLEDIKNIINENKKSREKEIDEVESIINNEINRLRKDFKHMEAEKAISTIQEKSHRLKEENLERLFQKMGSDFDEEIKEEVRRMADSLVNQLLAPPTASLKKAAEKEEWQALETAMRIFGRGEIAESGRSFEEEGSSSSKLI